MSDFRPPIHPGQANTLVHFCGRGRDEGHLPQEIATLSPSDRLERILHEQRLRAFPPFGSPLPAACFSESDTRGAASLLEPRTGWQAWGIVFSRKWAWRAGGGPVWYSRDDVHNRLKPRLLPEDLVWLVRTEPTHSDWLHEREWRIPVVDDVDEPSVQFETTDVLAILVAEHDWYPQNLTMDPDHGYFPNHIGWSVPRWWWNGTELVELPPYGHANAIW